MKRHENLIPFSHDHHHGLKVASIIKKDAPIFKNLPNDSEGKRKYLLDFYENDLKDHFREEEEILFPISKGKDFKLDGLWDEIIKEHKAIKELIEIVRKSSKVNEDLNKLGVALEEHIRKEERLLFPKIQQVLSEEDLKKIGEQL